MSFPDYRGCFPYVFRFRFIHLLHPFPLLKPFTPIIIANR
ncbi:hypothetical protein HMPREF9412_3056 [Paenibacillus sp. HGF5]|nr:hypothetical protein HMPREF9412_3056 [Paenibacillus sp. HGF5]